MNFHIFVKCEVARRVWSCWVDSLVNLLNVIMDIIDIAMKIFESVTSRDLRGFLWGCMSNLV